MSLIQTSMKLNSERNYNTRFCFSSEFNYNFINHTEASEVSEELIHAQFQVISMIKPIWLHSRVSLTRSSARLLSALLNAIASGEADKRLPDAPQGPSGGKT